MINNCVLILKTHLWSIDIEKFTIKILKDTRKCNVHLKILMHCETDFYYNKIKNPDLKNITIKFTENDIKKIYSSGYYNIWLSNHWILMWFFKYHGSNYEYYWSMEYDVRISGDSTFIWSYNENYDFLCSGGHHQNTKNKYYNHYVGNLLNDNDKYFGFLQLARYSKKALAYLDECYKNGENGQDELITFSLIKNNCILTYSSKFLQGLIKGVWTWQDNYSNYNKKIYQHYESIPNYKLTHIYHPVK